MSAYDQIAVVWELARATKKQALISIASPELRRDCPSSDQCVASRITCPSQPPQFSATLKDADVCKYQYVRRQKYECPKSIKVQGKSTQEGKSSHCAGNNGEESDAD